MDNLMLKSSLLCVFMKMGVENKLYSFKEVLGLFKHYVFANKHLIDPQNSLRIICKGDLLGRALGVDSFCVDEAKGLLAKCVIPIPMPENLRKSNESNDSWRPSTSSCYKSSQPADASLCRNSSCCCPLVFSVPDSPMYNSEAETVFSYQGYDTTLCEDDYEAESYHSVSEVETIPSLDENEEYEPVTDFDEYQSANHTDSDVDSFASGIFVLDHSDYYNEDCFADESDDFVESGHTSTEDEPDKWTCITCGIKNRPYMRYCLKCWNERKEWFPERPSTKKRRKSRPKKERKSSESKNATLPKAEPYNTILLKYQGSGMEAISSTGSFSSQDSGVVCSSQDSEMTCSQDSTSMSLSQESTAGTCSVDVLKTKSSFESGKATSSQKSVNGDQSLHPIKGSSSRIRERENDTEEPPSKYLRVFGPKNLQQIAVKFRKFTSTGKGRQWVKSVQAEGFRKRMESLDSDSEIEKVTAKFRRFTSSYPGRQWLESSESSDLLKKLSELTTDSDQDVSDRNCTICWSKVANASIVHGNISHLGVCYPCAKRLSNSNSRCPACRRKIDRITKICYV